MNLPPQTWIVAVSVFSEYVRSLQSQHSPSVAYAPQQNSLVERMWGVVFNLARILLHAANYTGRMRAAEAAMEEAAAHVWRVGAFV